MSDRRVVKFCLSVHFASRDDAEAIGEALSDLSRLFAGLTGQRVELGVALGPFEGTREGAEDLARHEKRARDQREGAQPAPAPPVKVNAPGGAS